MILKLAYWRPWPFFCNQAPFSIRNLTQRCFPASGSVRCYEMMCVHVGLVPVRFAARHIRRLAAMLFETSLGAHYPISLIQWYLLIQHTGTTYILTTMHCQWTSEHQVLMRNGSSLRQMTELWLLVNRTSKATAMETRHTLQTIQTSGFAVWLSQTPHH